MSKALTNEQIKQALDEAIAYNAGLTDGKEYKLSEPREPRFEDDFDVDTDPPDLHQYEYEYSEGIPMTLEDIAINKAHAYAQEYDGNTGGLRDKPNYHALKEGYMAGFLEGFAHRLTNNTGE